MTEKSSRISGLSESGASAVSAAASDAGEWTQEGAKLTPGCAPVTAPPRDGAGRAGGGKPPQFGWHRRSCLSVPNDRYWSFGTFLF